MPRIATRPKAIDQQFIAVNDQKLRMSLIALSDKIDQRSREIIYKTYNDPEIASIYRGIRNLGIYQHGGKSKVHRKIIEFPNMYVDMFVDTVLTAIYGKDWLKNKRALRHELVKPWHVVSHL
jgi:hypothetical protein